jgi:hypothetical protein
MVRGNRYIAAGLAAGLAISALATPSFAQRAEGDMSGEREKALRDCSAEAGKMSQSTWCPAVAQTPLLHDATRPSGSNAAVAFPCALTPNSGLPEFGTFLSRPKPGLFDFGWRERAQQRGPR